LQSRNHVQCVNQVANVSQAHARPADYEAWKAVAITISAAAIIVAMRLAPVAEVAPHGTMKQISQSSRMRADRRSQ